MKHTTNKELGWPKALLVGVFGDAEVYSWPMDIEETIEYLLNDRLPDRLRRVAYMRFRDFMTLKEAGNELNVGADVSVSLKTGCCASFVTPEIVAV